MFLKKKYVINKSEAIAVKKIFNMYINNFTYTEIVNWLDANNYKTKKNKKFNKNTIPVILKNIKYTGVYEDGEKGSNEYIKIKNGIPKVIEQELFNEAQKKINAKIYKNNRKNKKYLLTGKLKCEICGGSMGGYSRGAGSKRTYYCNTRKKDKTKCNRKEIKANEIETIVFDNIKNFILVDSNKDYIVNEVYKNLIKNTKINNDKNRKIRKSIKELEIKINNILNFVEQGVFSELTYDRLNSLEKERKNLNKLLDNSNNCKNLNKAKVNKIVESIMNRNREDTDKEKLIDLFIDFIEIDGKTDEINLVYKFDDMRPAKSDVQLTLCDSYINYIMYELSFKGGILDEEKEGNII